MVAKITTAGIIGIEGRLCICECDLSNGLPRVDVVGLPDAAVREAKDRVQAAVKNSGFTFPLKHIVINLAPAEAKKEGTAYDLPIFIGILTASEQLGAPPPEAAFVGELSLEGEVRPVSGVLPMALALREAGISELYIPAGNAREAAMARGIKVYPVNGVGQLLEHLNGGEQIPVQPPTLFRREAEGGPDMADVVGQEGVKRALTIAAAGFHHLLMIGPPGSGKSMMAKRLPSILPDLDEEEALEISRIHSVAGMLSDGSFTSLHRPFRSPHHSVSAAGLAGGGRQLRPGEQSLAHLGVLFLDELPEFRIDALETLRQPLEDGIITISRAAGSSTFPARFILICAMNPCKCGYYGHPTKWCGCSEQMVRNYRRKISGPLLDRIDMQITVPPVEYEQLETRAPAESSASIRRRVNAARQRQKERYRAHGILCNSELRADMMREFCALDPAGLELMRRAFDMLGLSARAYDRILKVARTIADLDGEEAIRNRHIAEAVQYRSLDREDA